MKLGYYITIGWRDALRSRGLLANVLIVAGICLPVLLLFGLQRGLVAKFRADIFKSPTAREVHVHIGRADKVIGRTREAELERTIPGVCLVIPEITKVAELEAPGASKQEVTLHCTKPGDPFLAFYGADVLEADDRDGIVVGKSVADKLGIPYVSSNGRCRVTQPFRILTLHVGRREQEGTEYQTKRLNVVGIVRTDTTGASIAFLSRQMMEWIQDFSYGRSVAALKWPGSRKPAKAQYEGYLAFTANPYTGGDLERLNLLGFAATPLDLADPEHRAWRQLYGLLRPHSLYVYWVRSGFATTTVRATVDRPPSEVEDITDTDEVILPWSPASVLDLAGTRCRVVGVTVRSRWLRQYFRDPATRLDAGEGELQVMLPLDPPGDAKSAGARTLALHLPGGGSVPLHVHERPKGSPRLDRPVADRSLDWLLDRAGIRDKEAARARLGWVARHLLGARFEPATVARRIDSFLFGPQAPPLAVVPADLTAHLAEREVGRVVYDPALALFVSASVENTYTEARMYADDLDQVPAVSNRLRDAGYLTSSSSTRVLEMQGYADTLRILVWTVMGAVLFFGIWTVFSVFFDVTDRKRGAIGIMRIMGMSPFGIFCIVFIRALVVGIFGGVFTLAAGGAIAAFITHVLKAACLIQYPDLAIVFAGALGCCLFGVLKPAWSAKSLDPVDAILTSKSQ